MNDRVMCLLARHLFIVFRSITHGANVQSVQLSMHIAHHMRLLITPFGLVGFEIPSEFVLFTLFFHLIAFFAVALEATCKWGLMCWRRHLAYTSGGVLQQSRDYLWAIRKDRHISRKRQMGVLEIIRGLDFSSPLLHPFFSSPPFPSLPLLFSPSLPLSLEVGPWNTARGSGDRCKLLSGVWGGAPEEIEFGAF